VGGLVQGVSKTAGNQGNPFPPTLAAPSTPRHPSFFLSAFARLPRLLLYFLQPRWLLHSLPDFLNLLPGGEAAGMDPPIALQFAGEGLLFPEKTGEGVTQSVLDLFLIGLEDWPCSV
jgi:hypothetical protein